MKNYLYSIVIPAYNAEKFIVSCLDSIKNQTYKNYEIIVVNDGSKDATVPVIKKYVEDNPKLNIHLIEQENGGAASARSRGIELSAMDYIAFLDADDVWYSEKLEKVNLALNNYNADVIYHDEYEIGLDGGKKRTYNRQLSETPFDDLIINGNALSTSTVVVEKTLMLKSNTFKEGKRAGEDIECWIKLAENGATFYHINEPLGEYRRVATSLTLKSIEYLRETDEMRLSYFDRLDKNKYSIEEIHKLKIRQRSLNAYNLARHYHKDRQFSSANTYYRKSLKYWKRQSKAYIGLILSCCRIVK